MPDIAPEQRIPAFRLEATGGKQISDADLRGTPTVLYFYPRDNTPGCTDESRDFAARHSEIVRHGFQVFGVSRDDLKSHERFKAKLNLPFELISDPEESLCQALDVMRDKNMYGRKVRGIERSTFLVDGDGIIRKIWRKVKVPGHVDEVLDAIKTWDTRL